MPFLIFTVLVCNYAVN